MSVPTIIDNVAGTRARRCRVYWRNDGCKWQGGHTPIKVSVIRKRFAENAAKGSWKWAEYRIEPVAMDEGARERLEGLKRAKERED